MHYGVKFKFLGEDQEFSAGPFPTRLHAEVFANTWRHNGRRTATVEPVDVIDVEDEVTDKWVKAWAADGKRRVDVP